MDISHVFNIEDLLPYQDTFEHFTLPSSVSAGKASKGAPTMSSLQYSKEMVNIILDDESVTSRDGGFRRFLVKWHCRPDSDTILIQEDVFRHLDPSLLDCYLSSHSSESGSFQPEGNDEAWSRPISRPSSMIIFIIISYLFNRIFFPKPKSKSISVRFSIGAYK